MCYPTVHIFSPVGPITRLSASRIGPDVPSLSSCRQQLQEHPFTRHTRALIPLILQKAKLRPFVTIRINGRPDHAQPVTILILW